MSLRSRLNARAIAFRNTAARKGIDLADAKLPTEEIVRALVASVIDLERKVEELERDLRDATLTANEAARAVTRCSCARK
jgi:hypothetical protein